VSPAAPRSIAAIIVTYNRVRLLEECLLAVSRQTRAPDMVIVIDNASTDDTPAMLTTWAGRLPRLVVARMPRNLGGSGGFSQGMRLSHAAGMDAHWLFDDDTIPDPHCLAELLAGCTPPTGQRVDIAASRVDWTDGRAHPMNVVGFKYGFDRETFLDMSAHGLLSIRCCTFVSCLVRDEAVVASGLPISDFFLWCDDIEYTNRILKDRIGVLCPRSLAVHKTAQCYSTLDAAPQRFFYHVRNQWWMIRKSDALLPHERFSALCFYLVSLVRYAVFRQRLRPSACWWILKGLVQGICRRPHRDHLGDGRDLATLPATETT
jgi:rhamnopyranosyl-N-acetylglucosaminyl-diphospho-decaprenol beta-1,3/1,4-galactofuranosyltransferase